ncbi:PilC/PilY family type IV pilus protein [Acinetobacter shaoyimingii]|uniref:Pilus assembly protein PilY n=1 Tax=Acinetobacter shaoyimingii TaxID=2715164 RepID=A0A6G8RZ60_9GAMM|nr:PilC/PilY family type IV pilus protein [Acinetobacter shaoyimingii]QIO07023.1 pilus assembly protein PilY [Acinetobacter shaoyimingii]
MKFNSKETTNKNNYQLKFLVALSSTLVTYIFTSSVVQASDLQIYATPTAGKKTIIMMLDTSGSMGSMKGSGFSYYDDYGLTNCGTSSQTASPSSSTSYSNNGVYYVNSTTTPVYRRNFCYVAANSATNRVKGLDASGAQTGTGCEKISNTTNSAYRCYDRITRLKDGMFALLNSTDPYLPSTKIGLGNYSADKNGDGLADAMAGKILVAAEELGDVNSTQRNRLRTQVANLSAYNGTPTANAFAEAAAYLMGTSTLIAVRQQQFRRILNNNSTYTYSQCSTYYGVNFNTRTRDCYSWSNLSSAPNVTNYDQNTVGNTTYYTHMVQVDVNESGFLQADSSSGAKIRTTNNYISPLPAAEDRQSCDGQGVYILSDGVPTDTVNTDVLAQALNDTSFSCSNGLTGGTNWNCMSIFAKKLFDRNTNPAGVSIQTAFVGFGAALNNLNTQDAKNACQMSSRTQVDRKSDDSCSPTSTHSNPGYGNGGFFIANQAQDVTNSVIQFIKNLGDGVIDPVPTGAISVPQDDLNPNGFQPFGYLRALSPNPGQMVKSWAGNLKKYHINGGALVDASNDVIDVNSKTIFDKKGEFDLTTKDIWNPTSVADGGVVNQGGVYWNIPVPTNDVAAISGNAANNIRAVPAIKARPNALRHLYTNVDSVNVDGELIGKDTGTLLALPTYSNSANGAYVLSQMRTQNVLKDFPIPLKIKILNYLGYDLDLTSTTELPSTLPVPSKPFVNLGGSIHSFPVQLTYSGELDERGDLTTIRKQSVLFGSMEGGLHIVDASTGLEQMVFVPHEILADQEASRALRTTSGGSIAYGMGGAWVADPSYELKRGSKEGASAVEAKAMKVYGGMRMGGKSYYALDVMNPQSPKLLFRIGADQSYFSRMGQSWSKPVIANIRYDGKIKRVLIVGGGYDMCYENPRFKLGTANSAEYGGGCNKTRADGNAVYIIDAETGKRLWWASNSGADTNNADMKHSIVSRVSTLDRNADGLIDHLYFGDLGGQVFRVDLNNNATSTSGFGVRAVRLANLATDENGNNITNGDAPRFYQPPTLTIHDEGQNTFILVAIASGDRSTPLDVSPSRGREGMLPSTALSNRPTNKVYGLMDHDFINRSLMSSNVELKSKDINLSKLQKNPQTLEGIQVVPTFFPYSTTKKQGWYRSLSSDYTGAENVNRTAGGIKAFEEEPIAITNNLIIPVYDPEGTGVEPGDACQPRIVGESDSQKFCLPYGVCFKSRNVKDLEAEKGTGLVIIDGKNQNVLGTGIRGITLGPKNQVNNNEKNSCGSLTLLGNTEGSGEWNCSRVLNPTRWYEKYVKAN